MMHHVRGRNAGHVVLYALSTCTWCAKVKQLLADLGVEHHFIDVDLVRGEDLEKAMQAVDRWNPGRTFPLLVINDSESIIGFNDRKIRNALSSPTVSAYREFSRRQSREP